MDKSLKEHFFYAGFCSLRPIQLKVRGFQLYVIQA